MTIFNGLLVNTAGLWGQRIVGLIGAHIDIVWLLSCLEKLSLMTNKGILIAI